MKTVYIMRGIPGSGKSTRAHQIAYDQDGAEICSADDFFIENGEYKFNPNQIGLAHDWCRAKFNKALCDGAQVIIVDNTNTTRKEYAYYKQNAARFGYRVEIVKCERPIEECIRDNKHGVPEATIRKMLKRFED